jgi:agmatine deiminase
VLLAWADEAEAASHPVAQLNRIRMRANEAILRASKDAKGRPLRVLRVPLPTTMERPVVLSEQADTRYSEQWSADAFAPSERRRNGDTVLQVATSSYLNFVVVNQLVLVPDYVPHGTPPARQAEVRQVFKTAFPGRKVRFIDAGSLNWFGGGAHCATLNEPLGRA